MKSCGYKVVYYSAAKIIHHITTSNRKVDPRITIKRHLGMSHYYKKHLDGNIVMRGLVNAGIALRCALQLFLNLLK